MAEVAVAGLDVDEVEAGALRRARDLDVVPDQIVERPVGQKRRIVLDPDPTVEHRMTERDLRRGRTLRAREASGVGQLEAEQRRPVSVIGRAGEQGLPQPHEVGFALRVRTELPGVRASVRPHGIGLPPPHEPGPALSEATPAPLDQLRRPAVAGPVPALHRKHAETIGGAPPCDFERLGERPVRIDRVVDRQRYAERGEPRLELLPRPQPGHLDRAGHAHEVPSSASSRAAISARTSRSPSGRVGASGWAAGLAMHPRRWRKIAASCL